MELTWILHAGLLLQLVGAIILLIDVRDRGDLGRAGDESIDGDPLRHRFQSAVSRLLFSVEILVVLFGAVYLLGSLVARSLGFPVAPNVLGVSGSLETFFDPVIEIVRHLNRATRSIPARDKSSLGLLLAIVVLYVVRMVNTIADQKADDPDMDGTIGIIVGSGLIVAGGLALVFAIHLLAIQVTLLILVLMVLEMAKVWTRLTIGPDSLVSTLEARGYVRSGTCFLGLMLLLIGFVVDLYATIGP